MEKRIKKLEQAVSRLARIVSGDMKSKGENTLAKMLYEMADGFDQRPKEKENKP